MKRLLQLAGITAALAAATVSTAEPPKRESSAAAPGAPRAAASAPAAPPVSRPGMPEPPAMAPAISEMMRQRDQRSQRLEKRVPAGQHDRRPATATRLLEQLQGRQMARRAAREQRRQASRQAVLAQFSQVIEREDVRQELELHARRVARLERIIDLAQQRKLSQSEQRAAALLQYEFERHAQRMSKLTGVAVKPASGSDTGSPAPSAAASVTPAREAP